MRTTLTIMSLALLLGCTAQGDLPAEAPGQSSGGLPPGSDISDWTPIATGGSGGEATVVTDGLLCTLGATLLDNCNVTNPELALDGDLATSADLNLFLSALDPITSLAGLDGSVTLIVPTGAVPAGQVAAFEVEIPPSVLQLGVLDSIDIFTLLDGQCQETTTTDLTGLEAQLEGLASGCADLSHTETTNILANLGETDVIGETGSSFLVGFVNTLPYDAVAIRVGATALHLDPLDTTLLINDVVTNAAP